MYVIYETGRTVKAYGPVLLDPNLLSSYAIQNPSSGNVCAAENIKLNICSLTYV